MDKTDHS